MVTLITLPSGRSVHNQMKIWWVISEEQTWVTFRERRSLEKSSPIYLQCLQATSFCIDHENTFIRIEQSKSPCRGYFLPENWLASHR